MKRLLIILAAVLPFAAARGAAADTFELAGGGKIEGELLNPKEEPRTKYVVAIAGGGEVSLDAAQVVKYTAQKPENEEYEKLRRRAPDTAEGQWAMAEWCRERKMLAERDVHLERVIELKPDHVAARRALGYSQADGRWVKREELMAERGMVLYKGHYRTPQEVELMESKRKQDLAEKDWLQKIDRWRGWFGTDRGEQGKRNIQDIEDAAAVKPLVQMLRRDAMPAARILYVDTLSKLGGAEAVQAIAISAMEDPEEEVRLTCLDTLRKKPQPEAIGYFVGQLRSKSNVNVNRAGVALKAMKDPSTILPLIDALVTTHKFKVTSNPGGATSATFGSAGGGGLSTGSSTKIVEQHLPNADVLDALVTITGGQNFNFDQRSWRHWYLRQKDKGAANVRRD